jgi:tRNA-dihydrouridine synthase
MVAATGCDAVMIGRTAPANPWIFRQIQQYYEALATPDVDVRGHTNHVGTGVHERPVEPGSTAASPKPYGEPSEADRYQMIRTYFRMLIEEELPDATGKMKQFASWFTHGVPGGATLRKEIYESKTAPEILTRVETFFEARLAKDFEPAEHSALLTQ